MLDFAKKTIRNRSLRKGIIRTKREKQFCNIESIKSVGILFENIDDMYVIANKMMKFFISRKIKISALAFENVKGADLEFRKQFPSYIKLFSKSELNWYGKPNCEDVSKFISQRFDVLIDISRKSDYVYKYITTMSMAKFKIGGIQYKNDPFDLIILEKSGETTKFLSLIINFLLTIKIQVNA